MGRCPSGLVYLGKRTTKEKAKLLGVILAEQGNRYIDAIPKAFLEACVALATIVVSDNILGATRNPYYIPSLVIISAILLPTIRYSRNRTWGPKFRGAVRQTSVWIVGVAAIIVLLPQDKQLGIFDLRNPLSLYNVGVAYYLVLGIGLAALYFAVADWLKEGKERSLSGLNPEFI